MRQTWIGVRLHRQALARRDGYDYREEQSHN